MAACWWPKWLLLVAKMAAVGGQNGCWECCGLLFCAGEAVAFCFVLARLWLLVLCWRGCARTLPVRWNMLDVDCCSFPF